MREFTGQNGTVGPFDTNPYRFPIGRTNNTGNGFAKGFDFFWRDQKTVKGLDYWVTYSYVDTRRLFSQYAMRTTPAFVSKHNASLITKRYFSDLRTNMGLTYTFTSGRPYYNPNRNNERSEEYFSDRTPAVHNLSFSASYITAIKGNFMVIYASVDNILNTRNVFTYRYTPDHKTRYAVGPQSYRSFFIGGVIMLSKKAKIDVNQL